jgi:hypothetical protein
MGSVNQCEQYGEIRKLLHRHRAFVFPTTRAQQDKPGNSVKINTLHKRVSPVVFIAGSGNWTTDCPENLRVSVLRCRGVTLGRVR